MLLPKSQRFSSRKSNVPTENLSSTGKWDGEKNPSNVPAMRSIGMVPASNWTASAPAIVSE
jgi:hypothetical protein